MKKSKKKSPEEKTEKLEEKITDSHAARERQQESSEEPKAEFSEELGVLVEVLMDTVRDLRTTVQKELEANPLKTLGVAFGVGYMLGGGVPNLKRSFLLSTLGRMVAKSIFRRVFESATGHREAE